jgi:hypothetical protein
MVSTRVLRRSQNRRSSEAELSSATAAESMRRDGWRGATASLGWVWGQGGTEWDRDGGKSFLNRDGFATVDIKRSSSSQNQERLLVTRSGVW